MSDILLGQTIRIRVTFRDWDNVEALVDPDIIIGQILDGDLVPWPPIGMTFPVGPGYPPPGIFTSAIVRESKGIYRYDWTPVAVGDYLVEFDGEFLSGATPSVTDHNIVREAFTVVVGPGVGVPAQTLGQDQYVQFMPELTPIYVDPQEILVIFPDASPIEVNELLYFYSYEINLLLTGVPFSNMAYDYLKAAVLCSLSRVFTLAGGSGSGSSNVDSLALGDLSIKTGVVNSNKTSSNLGNATTWCELALLLRRELTFTRIGFKAVEKGNKFLSPMPIRSIDKTRVR